jgi:hypothetical protein
MHTSSYKYELLNNKEWLRQKYIIEKLSTKEIAKLAGAKTPNSARQALIRNGIDLRTIGEGLTATRNDDFELDMDVIIGGLLGDAHMRSHNRNSNNSFPYFKKKNIGLDHVQYVAKLLFPSSWESRVVTEIGKNPFNNANVTYYKISTLSRRELLPIFRQWYPEHNGFKKTIPENISINSKILLHWFLDDGCTIYIKNKELVDTKFCAMSFNRNEQEILIESVRKNLDIQMTIRKAESGSGSDIWIPPSQFEKFMYVVGNCPVSSMQHKWKTPNRKCGKLIRDRFGKFRSE